MNYHIKLDLVRSAKNHALVIIGYYNKISSFSVFRLFPAHFQREISLFSFHRTIHMTTFGVYSRIRRGVRAVVPFIRSGLLRYSINLALYLQGKKNYQFGFLSGQFDRFDCKNSFLQSPGQPPASLSWKALRAGSHKGLPSLRAVGSPSRKPACMPYGQEAAPEGSQPPAQ